MTYWHAIYQLIRFIFRKLSVRWPVVMIKNLEDFHRILRFIILHMHTDKFLRFWPIYIYTFFGQLIRRCFEIESNIRSTSCFDRCHGGGLFTFVMWKECWVYLFIYLLASKRCTTILGKIRVKNISTSSALGLCWRRKAQQEVIL